MSWERKLLKLLSWGCQDRCIPAAMFMERFCWREDFVVGVRSFWRMMLSLSPGKGWWKNGAFLSTWPFWHHCHKPFMHEMSSRHSFVTQVHALNMFKIPCIWEIMLKLERVIAYLDLSTWFLGAHTSLKVHLHHSFVVVNISWLYTDSWQLLQCLKAHDPCSRQQEFALMFPVRRSHCCTCPVEPSSRAGGFWPLDHGDLICPGVSITS